MSNIAPISSTPTRIDPSTLSSAALHSRHQSNGSHDSITHAEDAVELSQAALDAGREPPIRQDLVDRIRAEIAAGTYETPDKLDTAADSIARELNA
ncbi:MAG TPA: flagellar biosynthesis anti-sigma factor FlgM [Gemmatimonadales bacterium]|nr:flagellar biosynthesis anti-sigma factor FlgM [Gemmatimonadales bacterium]